MSNHLMKRTRMANRLPGEPKPDVPVMNLTGKPRCEGVYPIPADGQWHDVPYELAKRLAKDENYRVRFDLLDPGDIPPSVVQRQVAQATNGIPAQPLAWPSVVIVVPVFNCPTILATCAKALKATDYPGKWRIQWVDNGSTDADTQRLLHKFSDSKQVVLNKPHGFAYAVNEGLKRANEDYYVLFNQDCEARDPEWLRHLITWMEATPRCGVAGAKLLFPNGNLQHAGIHFPVGTFGLHRYLDLNSSDDRVCAHERVSAVTGAVFCARASTWKALGGLDERYQWGCEDTDFCLRAQVLLGQETWYVPACTVTHLEGGTWRSSKESTKRTTEWREASHALFRNQWGAFVDRCATGEVAFVLPVNEGTAGGCRAVWALANHLVSCGQPTVVYTYDGATPNDPDFPVLFETRNAKDLRHADILVATRWDTIAVCEKATAKKRFYLVQSDEGPMAEWMGKPNSEVYATFAKQEYAIITIGQHLADLLGKYGRGCTVLDAGLYTALYAGERTPPTDTMRVLMYAAPAPYKGSDDQEHIAKAIREAMNGKVTIDSFHRRMGRPAWADNHFQPQGTKAVASLYRSHDVYVYSSQTEGFAMTPVEAMAAGTPVILGDFAGKDQYARHGANCLIGDSPKAIAKHVMMLHENKAVTERLREKGLETAARYDWANVAGQYAKVILGAP